MAFVINYDIIEKLAKGDKFDKAASKGILEASKEYYDNIPLGGSPKAYQVFTANLLYIQKIAQLTYKKDFVENMSYNDIRTADSSDLDIIAKQIITESGYF